MRLDEIYIFTNENFLLKLIMRQLYSKNHRKYGKKIAEFGHFAPFLSLNENLAGHPVCSKMSGI